MVEYSVPDYGSSLGDSSNWKIYFVYVGSGSQPVAASLLSGPAVKYQSWPNPNRIDPISYHKILLS